MKILFLIIPLIIVLLFINLVGGIMLWWLIDLPSLNKTFFKLLLRR